ncbi:hypothetical protein J3R83DRAFT_6657 [Lanmaoa asiatica]|nr:hypothetical protein J3R83DRAFT_6657 [Lanmaoa asiatica]
MSPHYYQAYVQAYSNSPPRTSMDGYTFSSTYVPGTANRTSRATPTLPTPSPRGQPSTPAHLQTTVKTILNHLTYGSWYQSGSCRCTRQGCPFTGSRKSVEIHMMDRHLVFPSGWEKKDDWDADQSLRGFRKPIAIQGTSLVLETPQAINAWIAERKRRFPTDEKIRDKKRKLEEAAARGQLTPEDIGAGARKKHKQNATFVGGGSKVFRGQRHQRGRSRRREGPVQREEPRTEHVDDSTRQPADAKIKYTCEAGPNSGSVVDDDEAPEVVSSKIPTPPLCKPKIDIGHNSEVQMSHVCPQESVRRIPQPKKPPRNPFVSRSTLLRNVQGTCHLLAPTPLMILLVKLLLPEIRVTVSNLSQAIHFLVDNDFLSDVELRPGEAQEQMIKVLGSSETPCSAQPHQENPRILKRDVGLRYVGGRRDRVNCAS